MWRSGEIVAPDDATRPDAPFKVKIDGAADFEYLGEKYVYSIGTGGAGALLRAAASLGNEPLVASLLGMNVSFFEADPPMMTPLANSLMTPG